MSSCVASILALSALALSHALSTQFPAGWNGLAATPPLAWRSYNAQVAFPGMPMDEQHIRSNIDALTSRTRTVDGVPTSLWDIGYRTVGIDGGWEQCVNRTMHDAQTGAPLVNTQLFPDLKLLVSYAHGKAVKMGWYFNNCGCPEADDPQSFYEGDVRAMHEMGFDGAKYDRCGAMLNSTLYAQLMNATGKAYLIENCHWGECTAADDSSCPTPSHDWCPFNFFRTSGDVRETWNSVQRNARTALRFLDAAAPLSRPHCWAYPDMLQVGNMASLAHDRAHFGTWVIMSAPLYLSFDLTDAARTDRVWPLITNREAIAVNQNWAGHPGRLVRTWTPQEQGREQDLHLVSADLNSCQSGWSYHAPTGLVRLQAAAPGAPEGCASLPPAATAAAPCAMTTAHARPDDGTGRYCDDGTLLLRPCDVTDPLQRFAFEPRAGAASVGVLWSNATPAGVPLGVRAEPWWEGSGVLLTAKTDAGALVFNGTSGALHTAPGTNFASDTCINASPTLDDGQALLLWAKPQPAGAVAVLLVNSHATRAYKNVSFSMREVGFTGEGEAAVRDVWQRVDVGHSANGEVSLDVPPRDSRFVMLTPA
eukprot:g519.t1